MNNKPVPIPKYQRGNTTLLDRAKIRYTRGSPIPAPKTEIDPMPVFEQTFKQASSNQYIRIKLQSAKPTEPIGISGSQPDKNSCPVEDQYWHAGSGEIDVHARSLRCSSSLADPRAGTVQCWTRTTGSVILLQLTGSPGGAVDRVASPQEGGLFRCTGAAILQRCRCDNGSEFSEISGWCRPR